MDPVRPVKDRLIIRHATAIAIITLTCLMAVSALVFWHQEDERQQSRKWVFHTYEVLGHIRAFYGKIKLGEMSVQSYLLSGDADDLAPYDSVVRNVPQVGLQSEDPDAERSLRQQVTILRHLTADNPVQQGNLNAADRDVGLLLGDMSQEIALRKAQGPAALAMIDFRRDKAHLDHAHAVMTAMTAEEARLLDRRLHENDLQARYSLWMIFASIGLVYVLLVSAVILYQRNQKRAKGQLLRYTEALERNEEELRMQQEELKASNEEIEASNEELEEKTRALEEQNAQIQQQSEELEESKQLIEEKASEVERASKYKSEFLANMSHELRTPLNSLLILSKLLAANEDGNLTASQIEEAQVIYNGGLELLGLINDILDLSKVEAGKLRVMVDDVAVDGIVQHMQQQFAPVVKDKGVAFPVDIAAGLPETLSTDSQRVEQILKNLLSNAFKFTETGSVTLKVWRPDRSLTLQRPSLDYANAVAFSVIDTGIGIEASKFKDIFEAFQQEDGSIDRHYGGTGLGLTIARKFAHMLGGEIHVESQKGHGSRFTLVLPVRLEGVADAFDAAAESDTPARIKLKPMPRTQIAEFIADDRMAITERDKVLLIIEDDPAFAATLMKVARKRGYKCLCAGDGKSGLVLVAEQRVDAIVLDLKLPDIDGLVVLEQLKHDLKTRHIPVHIISGRDAESAALPLRKGAIGYLTKPVAAEALDGVFARIEGLLKAAVKQVLVVEDDKTTQKAIQELLRKKDINITFVAQGEAALKKLAKTRFDCVILDLRLPDMTGFTWLEQMEKQAGDQAVPPVIVYTAQDLSEDENRQLSRYTGSIVIKGAKSPERLLDEVTLFLHSVESSLSSDQQDIIRMQHNPDKVLQGRTILLTDDDLRNTFALSKLLKKHGMNIVIADNGQMALDKLAEEPAIDLVIMDIMMPVMDGYQAMHEIRRQDRFKQLPIIALTARAMPEEQEKCMAAGANDYLTKPVDIERLLTLLRVWLFKQEKAA